MNRKKEAIFANEKDLYIKIPIIFQGLIQEALRIPFAKILNDQLLLEHCQSYDQKQADNTIYPH